MPHKQENPVLGVRKFCNYITLNIHRPNYVDLQSLDYNFWRDVERETNKTTYNTEDELKTMVTAVFSNLNKKTDACNRFQSHLEAMIEAKSDTFENI